MASDEITRPLNELFEKIYQTEKETLESQQKLRDLKKQINTVKTNIQQLKRNIVEKEDDVVEQHAKLASLQSQLTVFQNKRTTLTSILKKLDEECNAKAEEKATLQREYDSKHNTFCALVENLETEYALKTIYTADMGSS